MRKLLDHLADLWTKQINPRVSSFIAFFSIVWLAVCILATYVLAELSDEVLEREAFAIDRHILLFIHQFTSPALDAVFVGITSLGDPRTVVPLTVFIFCFLWLKRYRTEAKVLALDAAGGAVLSYFLKLAFSKELPQLWDSAINEITFSYPSGHALGSMVLYGFLSYVFASIYPRYAKAFYAVAALLITAIGLSRLYLGVHWPTDIVAGYCIGFLWISICITLLRLRKVKKERELERNSA